MKQKLKMHLLSTYCILPNLEPRSNLLYSYLYQPYSNLHKNDAIWVFSSGCLMLITFLFRHSFFIHFYFYFLQINVSHNFSIEKAKNLLGFQPKRITHEDWNDILKTLTISKK